MHKNNLFIIIYLLLLILSSLVFLNQEIYAEEIKQFQGFNSEINFKTDYEYKLLEYSFLNEEDKLIHSNFIKNAASIIQNGNQNEGSISQFGNFGSVVELIQIGNENRAEINQFANHTKAEVFQFGNNHDLSIDQWGSEGKIYVIQSGNNLENKEVKIIQF